MKIFIRVKPRARKNQLEKIDDNVFEARVIAPPEKGKANNAIIKLLAQHFKTAKSNITLLSGQTSREKIFEIN